jgi:phosphomannomutase
MSICFGTSGWRAVIADEFTFAGVRTATETICNHFEGTPHTSNPIVVGHDSRFLRQRFAAECAGIVSANGFRVLLSAEPVPTPVISHAILTDRVAGERRPPLCETPVGFKYIGESINEDKIILGGEESAGVSIKGHLPEKDGILACLLASEAVAARGASLTKQLNALYEQVGRLKSAGIDVRLTPELMASLPEKLKQNVRDIGGRPVVETNRNRRSEVYFCGRLVVAHAAVGH